MPLIRKGIVVDPMPRAECQSTVSAARNHHIGGRSPGGINTTQHINVVVSRSAGMVDCQEHLPAESHAIYPALNDRATAVEDGVSGKSRCLGSVLRVARS